MAEEMKVGFRTTPGCVALVTGSSGLCGARLVEMLVERGAKTVIAMDVATPNDSLTKRFETVQASHPGSSIIVVGGTDGDITNQETVNRAFEKAEKVDVVYHIAALVGPFYDKPKYFAVNLMGTRHIIEACKKYGVPKLVNSSSPSTRFHGPSISGLREDQMSFPKKFLALYAETKAQAEQEVTAANSDTLKTVNIGPHQVYGPHDSLALPKLLETAGNGRLRIFGKGDSQISMCYVDNYCHALMCGADLLLVPDTPILGKFYIVHDGPPQYFWDVINDAAVYMGFDDMKKKFHYPYWLLLGIAYIASAIGYLIGKKFKLNPFSLRMLVINRYFSLENSQRDLQYEPLYTFDEKWAYTKEWFKENWLPGYLEATGKKPKQA